MAFKYRGGDRTVEGVSRRAKQSGGGYDTYIKADFPKFKPREGENTIRILPPTWPKDQIEKYGDGWEVPIYLHRNVGPDNGTYLCSVKMGTSDTCVVCDARRDATDEDEADSLRQHWRGLVWLIDRDNDKAGPQWWDMPITVFREINTRSVDKKTKDLILIDDPEEGFDIMFNREGNDKRTDYTSIEVSRDSTPLHDNEDKQNKWLDFIDENPLPTTLNFYDQEHIEKVLFGKSERRKRKGEDDEEEDKPPSRRGRRGAEEEETEEEDSRSGRRRGRGKEEDEPEERGSRRSRRGEPEDEDETDRRPSSRRRSKAETEEEDEEVDAKSTSTRKRRVAKEPEEEPEEEEEETKPVGRRRRSEPEEEEEEEKPSSRRRRAPAEDEDEDTPSSQGRRQLGRLRDRK